MKPSKDFQTRYSLAKRWRDAAEPFIKEVLMFCCPGEEHIFDRKSISEYDSQVYLSLPEELSLDFASDLVTYFTPAEVKWASFLVTVPIPKDQQRAVLDIVQDREDRLFDIIQSTNYNDIAPQVFFEAVHGTPAMWVDKAHLSQPIHIETVPANELLIVPGHLGYLDRFRVKSVGADTLEALFRDYPVTFSQKLRAKMQKPGQMCEVVWGFWLDWSDPGRPIWRCEITVDGERVTPADPLVLGDIAGSCPLLVGRFNPRPGRPWGRGPGWKALPDMRVLDKIDEVVLSGLDQSILNTLIYPDDGFLDLSEGIEAGRAYPAGRAFDRNQIFEMNKGVNLDYGFFSEERLEERLRAAFYQDGPRQRGDTPPTASQWLDERRRVQQRLGKPSAPLWSELILPFVQRIEKLAVESGDLDSELTHDGEIISVRPVSPLQKAQNQDKVMVARSNLDLAFSAAGENAVQFVDFVGTFQNIVKASGDELTIIRKEEEVAPETPQPAGPPA